MAITVTELITRAYYLSGVRSQDFQTVTGDDLSTGLYLLNDLLAIKTTTGRMIPYFKEYVTTAVIGQQAYFIPNLIAAETVTFNQQTVRYSTLNQSRTDFFGSPRVDGIQSLPFGRHIERSKGGSTLYFYFVPNQAYPIKIWGKFALSDVTADEDLSLTLDRFYIAYLRYALAEYICNEFQIMFAPSNQQKLDEIEAKINDISPIDFTLQKIQMLSTTAGLNWAQINFPGWTAS